MKFNIDDYVGKYVMHCRTQEDADMFCEYLSSVGKTWRGGTRYVGHTNYHMYGDSMCYDFQNGQYCHVEYFIDHGYEILEFDDFIFDDYEADIQFSFDEMFGGEDE